ncbi:hypothetical protein HF877_00150 [Rhodococcus sp. BL-253-APC-6A1W]|uniref:hypothetical protein n=1 Tax=Rhodococcus sp. BL-253-APC-6A1W TaxID=2725307 RepID=UPI00146DE79D|nr:hypothetical protein [Rhodococcus sp. BL-253-APC-6A1W]NMD93818.1 hypothetical protein [Rhodococcus sp. BL-253-APC-6A1W]
MTSTEDRADRFTRELAQLKIPDPAAGRHDLWLRLGLILMVAGPVLGVASYFLSHNTSDALVQRDAIVLAIVGVAVTVVGSAVFLRYSLTGFLRFWMARQAFDLAVLSDSLSRRDGSS